jgi:hypothetical protein
LTRIVEKGEVGGGVTLISGEVGQFAYFSSAALMSRDCNSDSVFDLGTRRADIRSHE